MSLPYGASLITICLSIAGHGNIHMNGLLIPEITTGRSTGDTNTMKYKRSKEWWTITLLAYLKNHKYLSSKQWSVLSKVTGIPEQTLTNTYYSNKRK